MEAEMATRNPKEAVRCAIYTRKSSEEGLEMSFNSLDAQREACQAFIISQREEGWRALPALFDDGGYSGGSMERPALKRLLEEVERGRIDTIVVYKVDRLTRSLADFAKIVEALDARGVSFVSVTQQFNTTSSMGRLTLNVLLSFAQFEREVTGERIRDKIAASKHKGMWMGGRVPLGYDVKHRHLVVNQEGAELVNYVYRQYLELGSVSRLKADLDRQGIKSKERISVTGVRSGGVSFFPGALYSILANPIYLGEVRHRDQSYPGQHEAILQRDLWEEVQAKLRSDNQGRRNGVRANCSSILMGLLQDEEGNRFSPSHTVKNGKRYRYYIRKARVVDPDRQSKAIRLPAYDVERQVSVRVLTFLRSTSELMKCLGVPGDHPNLVQQLLKGAKQQAHEWGTPAIEREFLRKTIHRVLVYADRLSIEMSRSKLRASLTANLGEDCQPALPQQTLSEDDLVSFNVDARLKRCGGEMRVVILPDSSREQPIITPMLRSIVAAYKWREELAAGGGSKRTLSMRRLEVKSEYQRRVLGCAFLAPDIVEAILDGHHSSDLTVKRLSRRHLPLDWSEQRSQLGFPARELRATPKS
jgi:site-specific DNA recombinase